MKSSFNVIVICAGLLSGCYQSPGEPTPALSGIWKAADYDQLLRSANSHVVMILFEEDRLSLLYNERNRAFNVSYEVSGNLILLDPTVFFPGSRVNEFDFERGNVLEVSGGVFNGFQDFVLSDPVELEEYKQEFLLNAYGRWDGFKYGLYFELDPVNQGFMTKDDIFYTLSLVDSEDGFFIRAVTEDQDVQLWPYFLKRNELRVSFPDGFGVFDRVFKDNIVRLN